MAMSLVDRPRSSASSSGRTGRPSSTRSRPCGAELMRSRSSAKSSEWRLRLAARRTSCAPSLTILGIVIGVMTVIGIGLRSSRGSAELPSAELQSAGSDMITFQIQKFEAIQHGAAERRGAATART
ncbi:MAG: hypothetical protein M0C28_00675 [Candidatus Moduliflexus flocculans]|nr:hypothetical protein [Candidatus Moduliflexus flocculans]